jgi:carbon monoxide dehydrogenase subunit G
MKFEKTVRINATPQKVWELVDDIEAIAGCIPGIGNYSSKGPLEFDALLTQKVGPVIARFQLNTKLTNLEHEKSVTAISEGRDPDLDSSVRAEQHFELSPVDDQTEVLISADIRMTGRLATFGQRIILAKTEQVVIEALQNVSELLEPKPQTRVDPTALER